MEPKHGDIATCQSCGQEIIFVGPYWDRTGENKPRHIAMPRTTIELPIAYPAPSQPNWTRQLDSREWSQVLHAQAYAKNHTGAGAPGHGQFLLIAKLAKLLDEREPFENGTPNV